MPQTKKTNAKKMQMRKLKNFHQSAIKFQQGKRQDDCGAENCLRPMAAFLTSLNIVVVYLH